MFWKTNSVKQDLDNLWKRVITLEARVQQLECPHAYVLTKYAYDETLGCKWLEYKCACGHTKYRLWCDLSKQEQQAAKIFENCSR